MDVGSAGRLHWVWIWSCEQASFLSQIAVGSRFYRPRSMSKQVIRPSKAAPAVGPYSQAVRVGSLLFCAGQIPVDPVTGALVEGDVRAQTEQVLRNIGLILQDQGLTFDHVVKTTVFLVDLQEFTAMNEVYAKFFTREHPARSTVQVAALPKGARVEIEAIACYDAEKEHESAACGRSSAFGS